MKITGELLLILLEFISLINNKHSYNNKQYDYILSYAFSERAGSKGMLKDWKVALLDHNKAISINPNEGRFYHFRGLAKIIFLNDKEGGCLDLSKAGALGYSEAYKNIKDFCN